MKTLYTVVLVASLVLSVRGQAVLFQQNFDAGGPLSQYINGGSPASSQFTNIQGLSAAIVNNTLQFDRSAGSGTAQFTRNASLGATRNSLYVQLDFEVVSLTAAAASSALVFYIGSGFESGTTNAPLVSEMYARFGINTTDVGGQFSVRYINSNQSLSVNSGIFSGKQTITFVLNNTDYRVTYLQPGGGMQTLDNDKFDLWVGATQAFNEYPVQTATQSIENFKLRIDTGLNRGIYQFDNFLIRDITGILPLELTHVEASQQADDVQLRWLTATTDAAEFAIERRTQAGEFIELGTLPATDQRAYHFTDEHPQAGLNYYRLRQADRQGAATWSKLVEVRYKPSQPALLVLNNPTLAGQIRVRTYALAAPTYRLTTLIGQAVPFHQRETPDGDVLLLPQQPLPSGVYWLTAQSGTYQLTRRVLVQ